MNHSDMNHEHMHMSHHSIDTAMVSGHASTHPETTVSSLWTFSNSIETVLIVLFIGFVILKSDAWKNHKLILSLTAVWFFLSMHPLTDSLARHSVWLHCLQSSLIHHLLPLALFLSIHTQTAQVHAQPQVKTAGLMIINIITFNLMSLIWVLPSLHMQLMHDALLYSSMKWTMAITGILLCKSMLSFDSYSRIAGLNYSQFSALMLMPQALIGVALMVLPPLYPMPEGMMAHLNQTVTIAHYLPQLSEQTDQLLGGLLLLMATVLFWSMDLKRRRDNFFLSTPLPIQKEMI